MSIKQKERFNSKDLFRELAGRRFINYGELEETVLEIINRHLESWPLGYTFKNAIRNAEQKGWLIKESDGLLVSMHQQKVIQPTAIQRNNVDALIDIMVDIQERCRNNGHQYRLITLIRLYESRMRNIWWEKNTLTQLTSSGCKVEPARWKCQGCSVLSIEEFITICPFCFSTIAFNIRGMNRISEGDFSKYFEERTILHSSKNKFPFYINYCDNFNCHAGFIQFKF